MSLYLQSVEPQHLAPTDNAVYPPVELEAPRDEIEWARLQLGLRAAAIQVSSALGTSEAGRDELAAKFLDRIDAIGVMAQLALKGALDEIIAALNNTQSETGDKAAKEPTAKQLATIIDLSAYRTSHQKAPEIDETQLSLKTTKEKKTQKPIINYLLAEKGLDDQAVLEKILGGTFEEQARLLQIIAKDTETGLRKGEDVETHARAMVVLAKARRYYRDRRQEAVWAGVDKSINEALGVFITKQRSLVSRLVYSLVNSRGSFTLEDYISEGNLGLMQSLERYDLAQKVRFSMWCVPRVHGAAIDAMRDRGDTVSKSRYDLGVARKFNEKIQEAEALQSGKTPEQMAAEMKVSLKRIDKARTKVQQTTPTSIDANVQNRRRKSPEAFTIGDTITMPGNLEIQTVAGLTNQEDIADLMQCLPSQQKLVIEMYYFSANGGPYKGAEIAEFMGVTKSRVSQLHQAALTNLRQEAPDWLREYVK